MQSLAEGLRVELSPFDVDVLASAPGPVHSGFAARAHVTMGAAATPALVAQHSLAALGRTTAARPGLLSKVLGGSLALLPRWARVRVMAAIMGGMTTRADTSALIATRPQTVGESGTRRAGSSMTTQAPCPSGLDSV